MSLTDRQLIASFVRDGDSRAFDLLAKRHLPLMRRVLFAVLGGNEEDMADAQQEVLIALYRNLSRFRGEASFTTWLYRFTHNRAIDWLRAARRRRKREELGVRAAAPAAEATAPDPEDRLLREERRARVLAAFAGLRPAERLLVSMREVEGMPVDRIARTLGIPVGTVKSRLSRVRSRLAGLLAEQFDQQFSAEQVPTEHPGASARAGTATTGRSAPAGNSATARG